MAKQRKSAKQEEDMNNAPMNSNCWAIEYGDNFEENEIVVDSITGRPVYRRPVEYSQAFRKHLSKVFLPEGFPESVQPEYIEYQLWDTVQVIITFIINGSILCVICLSIIFYVSGSVFIFARHLHHKGIIIWPWCW
jgi:hypothetical protein